MNIENNFDLGKLKKVVARIGDSFVDKRFGVSEERESFETICLHDEQFGVKEEDRNNEIYNDLDYTYMQNLKARAIALVSYLNNNKNYSKWSGNWRMLSDNLSKRGYAFQRLNQSNGDVAHVINKGDKIEFRIRDKSGKYIPINIYQYVMCHEMAHMATNEIQHTDGFWNLLSIMTFAMFEMGLFDFQKLRKFKGYYNSNGQPILSLGSIKDDIKKGISIMKKANGNGNYELYERLVNDL